MFEVDDGAEVEVKEFEAGEYISVSNGSKKMKKRIFLLENPDGNFVCVHALDEEAYLNGETKFRVGTWSVAEEYEPEAGDEVEVSNGGVKFSTRLYLGESGGKIVCVDNRDVDKYKEGSKNYRVALWNMLKD